MIARKVSRVLNNLNEYFSSAWTLLSDTTIFLSNNTKIFYQYESHLRDLRHRLESNRTNEDVIREVRSEVAAIRKALRMQGYNFKLGSLDLRLEGFRNDDALSSGFKRCVIILLVDGDVLYLTGTANHIDLDSAMDARMTTSGYRPVSKKHYLWFKWANRVLILSGAASESADDFENLKDYVSENKEFLLKKLTKIN
ncbi:MAG: hypothetical protein B6241_11420 [Spirochaetaceae bacterium 4572_59]|nr:MAG: hypothetical protein B6241_11420 [Spirochaetaceae bacterium 4572_59]